MLNNAEKITVTTFQCEEAVKLLKAISETHNLIKSMILPDEETRYDFYSIKNSDIQKLESLAERLINDWEGGIRIRNDWEDTTQDKKELVDLKQFLSLVQEINTHFLSGADVIEITL